VLVSVKLGHRGPPLVGLSLDGQDVDEPDVWFAGQQIWRSMDELLDRARKDRFERVHVQLLSAGPGRIFPAYSFTEMVRPFGA
jgi:hypothetical protein